MFGQEILDTVGAELDAAGIGKDGVVFGSFPFLEPGFYDGERLFGEGSCALFAALSETTHMGSRAQEDVATTETDEFAETKAGLDGQHEKCPISTTSPLCGIGCSQECLNLWIGKKVDQTTLIPFGRDSENTVNMSRMGGILKREVLEERSDGGQTKVACASAVVSLILYMFQECTDKRSI
jgi:hypothetical protein